MEAGQRRGSTAFNITSIIGTNDDSKGKGNERDGNSNQRKDTPAFIKSYAKSSNAMSRHDTISVHDTIRQNHPFISQQHNNIRGVPFGDSRFDPSCRFLHEFQAREKGYCHEFSSVRDRIVPITIGTRMNPELLKSLRYEDAPDMCNKFPGYLNQRINPYCPYYPGYVHSVPSPFTRQGLGAFHNESRRIRTTFTPPQLRALERRFKTNHYIVGDERKLLAQELSLNESQVKVWFQNRRTKYKQDREFEELGKSKVMKRKGEHHVRKWQIETKNITDQEATCEIDNLCSAIVHNK
eukprot:Seg3777.1 transcript_id=Seg3777.1/GoldUCD/mRNA.D3Y31 product="Homeobox protein EMX1" protein_id=Seg3777.1/GoldUCD/D3Y31